ncbi:TPA: glycosyltransferase family 2 protein [Vibrio parahaemolyticus]|uniref:Putative glycosyltransferase EpsE n=1 Tax=Vibrio parahaemolyticus TaxID=670 RepID=A0A7M1WS71_VIBPH|nr:glycosyltransferase family 2 protein [Vibrio parahaemolyticus]EGQ8523565.1 glycosyltransferase [Vibrio parahaemolyticus]EGQ9167641.1 glycosyltransferase family 2 protein [Vibrio parahaemolyticus]EGQ9207561.1 glycosyltransferase family 2 protein [Vibrio parahaemolyticus]EGQ9786004.1 glycosyltransferase family 2 protein [Vibrio parahaemolyticus]EGQ9926354.1 glycosyltransferase family 2 protein [Vibrio parahaemolyticus]
MHTDISIICSAYNSEATISDMIDSILKQSYQNFLLYIVNDGSTDNTLEIIERFSKLDERIIVINRTNHGLTKSLNYCLERVKSSEYVARIDSDDVWHCEKLEKQIKFMKKNPHVGILGTDFNEFLKYEDEESYFFSHGRIPIKHSEIIAELPFSNPFLHSSILIRMSILEKVGYYNQEFTFAQDYELWSRILKVTQGENLPEILSYRRYSENMISITKERSQRYYALRVKLRNFRIVTNYKKYIFQLLKDLGVCTIPTAILKKIRKPVC